MSDFINFLFSPVENAPAPPAEEDEQVKAVGEEEEQTQEQAEPASFLEFIRDEFGAETQAEATSPTDRSFRRFVTELMLEKRTLQAMATPPVTITPVLPASPAPEMQQTEEPALFEDKLLESKPRTIRFPKASEILRSAREKILPEASRVQVLPPPSLKMIGNFRERTALDILQTLAEREETERSEISADESSRAAAPILVVQNFQVAAISEVPREKEIVVVVQPAASTDAGQPALPKREVRLAVSKTGKTEMAEKVSRKPAISRRVGEFEQLPLSKPSLRREIFRNSLIAEKKRAPLSTARTDKVECYKTEFAEPGDVALRLDLLHLERLSFADLSHSSAPCDCPLHRHKVRIAYSCSFFQLY